MVMGVPAPQFPFDTFLQSYQASRPKQVAGQALGNLASELPDLISLYQQEKQKQKFKQAMQGLNLSGLPAGQADALKALAPFLSPDSAGDVFTKSLSTAGGLEEKRNEFIQRQQQAAQEKERDRQMREFIAQLMAGARTSTANTSATVRAQTANAQHPMMNALRSLFGKGPVVQGPGQQQQGAPVVTNVQVTP